MGIHNRDYLRDDQDDFYGGSSYRGSSIWSACRWLITITVAIFVLQLMTKGDRPVSPVTQWLALNPELFKSGQVWRILTYAFCHDVRSPFHILFNMLFLYWFGTELERMYGRREFLLLYLVSAVFSGIVFVVVSTISGTPNPTIGASGAIMAVVIIFACYYPRHKILLMFIFPIEIRWLVLFYVVFDLFPVLQALSGNQIHDGIAHSAHVGGLLIGFLYWKYQWRFEKFLPGNFSMPKMKNRHQRKFKVFQPDKTRKDEDLEKNVDEILAKISREGESSLTEKERKILKKASEKYKNR